MNRYILIDLQENCISNLNVVDTNFDINEEQTGSVTCTNKKELLCELLEQIKDIIESEEQF